MLLRNYNIGMYFMNSKYAARRLKRNCWHLCIEAREKTCLAVYSIAVVGLSLFVKFILLLIHFLEMATVCT